VGDTHFEEWSLHRSNLGRASKTSSVAMTEGGEHNVSNINHSVAEGGYLTIETTEK